MEEGHCEQNESKRKPPKARQGRGEAKELPPAADAISLFRDAVVRLKNDLTTLEARREYLKDKRFVVEYLRSGEAGESWIRHRAGDFTDAHWRSFCLEHGEDPGQDSIDVPLDLLVPGGVSQTPPEPLTRLIGAYILADLPVEALLRKLHDEPETVNLEQLDLHINGKKSKDGKVPGLKTRASDVARLVRGGGLTPGRTTGNL
ncbi:MAG: hypothetical protein LC781_21445, partial [Actinobacteria bacterium]|nr:hypothetical protein [Actinomycetota bacterium]